MTPEEATKKLFGAALSGNVEPTPKLLSTREPTSKLRKTRRGRRSILLPVAATPMSPGCSSTRS